LVYRVGMDTLDQPATAIDLLAITRAALDRRRYLLWLAARLDGIAPATADARALTAEAAAQLRQLAEMG
jgi:hypothetical protein